MVARNTEFRPLKKPSGIEKLRKHVYQKKKDKSAVMGNRYN